MRTFLVSLALTLAVAASLIVIIDRFQGRGAAPGGQGSIEQRLAAIEKGIQDLQGEVIALREPTPLPGSAPREPGLAGPAAARHKELKQDLEDLADMLFDAERSLRRDLLRMHESLTRRLSEMDAARAAGEIDPEKAKELVRAKLVEMDVTIDETAKRIQVAGMMCQPSRALELLAVGEGGRAHESLLLIRAEGSALKIALEDLGLVEAQEPDEQGNWPGDPDKAWIYVRWEGQEKPRRVEDLVINAEADAPMERTGWVFTASRFFTDTRTWERRLSVDVYRNVIALTRNYSEEAILASPLEAAWNENIWFPNPEVAPPPGTDVEIFFCKEPVAEWDETR